MVCTSYKTVYAMLAALCVGSTSAGPSVCYAPWHNAEVTKEILLKEILEIGTYFSGFRTFETLMAGQNIIQVAGEAGVKVAAGVQMNDLTAVDAEIEAVCAGFLTHPQALEAVYVGNENLQNNGFGTVSADQLIGYIIRVKECTHGAVPVGTVQRINEWLSAEDAGKVAKTCDLMGVNSYPYFTQGAESPIEKLQAQWEQMTAKYDAAKCRLTETGWPTKGEDSVGNHASLETAQAYFEAFVTWSQDKGSSYWFMMYDTTKSYTGMDYEMHFGLFTATGTMKVKIPSIGAKTGIPDPAIVPRTNSSDNGHVDNPAQGMPGQVAPVQETPKQETPVQETPVKGTLDDDKVKPSVFFLTEPLSFDENNKTLTGIDPAPYQVKLSEDTTTSNLPVSETGNGGAKQGLPEGHLPTNGTPVASNEDAVSPLEETKPVDGGAKLENPEQKVPTEETPVVESGSGENAAVPSVGVPLYRGANGNIVDGDVEQGISEKHEPMEDAPIDCAM